MAEAAVEFFLENLKNLLQYHSSHLIRDTKRQIEGLESDLRIFKSSLKDLKRRKDERTQALVRNLRDVIWEAEDVIDAIVTEAAKNSTRSFLERVFPTSVHLHILDSKVEAISKKIEQSRKDFANLAVANLEDESSSKKFEAPILREENVVGFEDEISAVIGYLTQQTEKLDVVTLVGMPGIGKTTLAWKIFNDPSIEYEFPIRIWVHVSNEFTKKSVLLSILRQLRWDTEDATRKSEVELMELVLSYLRSQKFLLVLDDVWSASDRDILGIAQLASTNNRGKVVITTCNEEVGRWRSANIRARVPYKVRFLSESESWELLQLEVFREMGKCPPELETVGRLIAKQCDGLPLAIVAMGDILDREDYLSSLNIKARKTAWIKACQRVPKYRDNKFYDNLPTHLQACFLYLAAFPHDFEIPADKLIWMWIAEGFVKEDDDDGLSLEETAEIYLQTLIDRNLLKVSRIKDNGRVKTCRIHRVLHDLCKVEAGNKRENIVTEIKLSEGDNFEPPSSQLSECRRLSIHSNVSHFLSSTPKCPRSRAFISFSKEKTIFSAETSSAIPRAFRLVRVLHVKPITFTRISSDMYHLVHLRYLALSLNFGTIPKALSKLWNMQTLLVHTTSRTLEVKADISGFTQLRHFKTKASANLLKPGRNVKSGENLQSLSTISPESCTKELCERARNLKELGIRGKLSLLLEGKIGSFDSLAELRSLENLKLVNDAFPLPISEGRLDGLPKAFRFPPRLRSLTLADTFLDWKHMSTLGLLEHLEVLKLKENAFVGNIWETSDGGFRRLEALHIARTDLVIWVVSAHHFPRLRSLRLRHCQELQEVPITLAEIPSFRLLDLFQTNLAAASAKRLLEKKLKEQSMDAEEFKLSIYPPSYQE